MEPTTILDREIGQAVAMFEREARLLLKHPFVCSYNLRDRMRLVNLVVWTEKYKMSYHEIFQILVNYWRGKFPSRNPNGLGIKPAVLVGKQSRDLIERFITQRHPGFENIALWKASEQSKIIAKLTPESDLTLDGLTDDPTKLVSTYRAHIQDRQAQAKGVSKKMRRRHYRTNPFF